METLGWYSKCETHRWKHYKIFLFDWYSNISIISSRFKFNLSIMIMNSYMLICRVGFSVTETLCIHETFFKYGKWGYSQTYFLCNKFTTSFYKKNELITPQPPLSLFFTKAKTGRYHRSGGRGAGGGTHLTFSRRKYFFFHLHIENCEIMQLLISFLEQVKIKIKNRKFIVKSKLQ